MILFLLGADHLSGIKTTVPDVSRVATPSFLSRGRWLAGFVYQAQAQKDEEAFVSTEDALNWIHMHNRQNPVQNADAIARACEPLMESVKLREAFEDSRGNSLSSHFVSDSHDFGLASIEGVKCHSSPVLKVTTIFLPSILISTFPMLRSCEIENPSFALPAMVQTTPA